MEMTKESWDALIRGQAVERAAWHTRMNGLAKQIEKLSACIEDMDQWGMYYEEAEQRWNNAH